MKHIQTYTIDITDHLHEGPVGDGVDVKQMSELHKLRILEWCESQGFEAHVKMTSHENEYTTEEQAESEAEAEWEFLKVKEWDEALNVALMGDPKFIFDGDMKGVYFYADADGNDNNMDFTGLLTYRTKLQDNTWKNHTVKGSVVFTCDFQWMRETCDENYMSAVIQNPCFLDLIQVFEEMLRYTGDLHHIFYEGLVHNGVREDGVTIYNICTGS